MTFDDLAIGAVFRLPAEDGMIRPLVKLSDNQAGALLSCHRFFFNPGEPVLRYGLDNGDIVVLGERYGLDDRTALFVLGYVLKLLNVRDRAVAMESQRLYFEVDNVQ